MDFFYTKTADALLKSARKFISGRDSNYVFFKAENPLKQQRACTSIYVHIPFCNSLCPYCPYNRIPEDKARLALYIEALKKEITGISGLCGRRDVSSVYFGGGTPLLTGEKIKEITRTIRDNYNVSGDFCIEANPNDINEDSVELLKQAGFASISLGVQSFNDDLLKSIGRKYASSAAVSSAIKLLTSGFDSVNIDLLFALPGQNMDCLMNDLEKAVSLKPDQITTYPLFTFPYSEISQFKKIKHVESPSLIKRRRMYYSIYEYLEKSGYKRCSVWSFKREK
ncbi:MAG: radical SAM protein, partial [bacterium]|nr:radical SAM protein [bacterium]